MTKRQERSPANIKTNETKLVGHKRPKPIGQRGRSKRLTEQPKVYNWPKARTHHRRNRIGCSTGSIHRSLNTSSWGNIMWDTFGIEVLIHPQLVIRRLFFFFFEVRLSILMLGAVALMVVESSSVIH